MQVWSVIKQNFNKIEILEYPNICIKYSDSNFSIENLNDLTCNNKFNSNGQIINIIGGNEKYWIMQSAKGNGNSILKFKENKLIETFETSETIEHLILLNDT